MQIGTKTDKFFLNDLTWKLVILLALKTYLTIVCIPSPPPKVKEVKISDSFKG